MPYAIDVIIENFGTIGSERKEIMLSVIQKYSHSDAPLDVLGVAYALYYSGAKYRASAIEYFEKFLASPVDLCKLSCVSNWQVYSYLSILYEREHQYEKAILYLKKCIEADNGTNFADYTRIGDILVKIDIYQAEQYYKQLLNNSALIDYKPQFEYAFNEVIQKKKIGYVYRPRKKKEE